MSISIDQSTYIQRMEIAVKNATTAINKLKSENETLKQRIKELEKLLVDQSSNLKSDKTVSEVVSQSTNMITNCINKKSSNHLIKNTESKINTSNSINKFNSITKSINTKKRKIETNPMTLIDSKVIDDKPVNKMKSSNDVKVHDIDSGHYIDFMNDSIDSNEKDVHSLNTSTSPSKGQSTNKITTNLSDEITNNNNSNERDINTNIVIENIVIDNKAANHQLINEINHIIKTNKTTTVIVKLLLDKLFELNDPNTNILNHLIECLIKYPLDLLSKLIYQVIHTLVDEHTLVTNQLTIYDIISPYKINKLINLLKCFELLSTSSKSHGRYMCLYIANDFKRRLMTSINSFISNNESKYKIISRFEEYLFGFKADSNTSKPTTSNIINKTSESIDSLIAEQVDDNNNNDNINENLKSLMKSRLFDFDSDSDSNSNTDSNNADLTTQSNGVIEKINDNDIMDTNQEDDEIDMNIDDQDIESLDGIVDEKVDSNFNHHSINKMFISQALRTFVYLNICHGLGMSSNVYSLLNELCYSTINNPKKLLGCVLGISIYLTHRKIDRIHLLDDWIDESIVIYQHLIKCLDYYINLCIYNNMNNYLTIYSNMKQQLSNQLTNYNPSTSDLSITLSNNCFNSNEYQISDINILDDLLNDSNRYINYLRSLCINKLGLIKCLSQMTNTSTNSLSILNLSNIYTSIYQSISSLCSYNSDCYDSIIDIFINQFNNSTSHLTNLTDPWIFESDITDYYLSYYSDNKLSDYSSIQQSLNLLTTFTTSVLTHSYDNKVIGWKFSDNAMIGSSIVERLTKRNQQIKQLFMKLPDVMINESINAIDIINRLTIYSIHSLKGKVNILYESLILIDKWIKHYNSINITIDSSIREELDILTHELCYWLVIVFIEYLLFITRCNIIALVSYIIEQPRPTSITSSIVNKCCNYLLNLPMPWNYSYNFNVTGLLLKSYKWLGNYVISQPISYWRIQLTNQIPVYVINLSKRLDRWNSMAISCDNSNLLPIRISGIDISNKADILDKEVSSTWNTNINCKYDSNCREETDLAMTSSERACAASHIKTWKYINTHYNQSNQLCSNLLHININENWFIILEDDATPTLLTTIHTNLYAKLTEIIRKLPDNCHICYLGGYLPTKKDVNIRHGIFYKVNYIWGLHAYMINRSTITMLLQFLPCDAPIDCFIGRLIHDKLIIAYALIEPLFKQAGCGHGRFLKQRKNLQNDVIHSGIKYKK